MITIKQVWQYAVLEGEVPPALIKRYNLKADWEKVIDMATGKTLLGPKRYIIEDGPELAGLLVALNDMGVSYCATV